MFAKAVNSKGKTNWNRIHVVQGELLKFDTVIKFKEIKRKIEKLIENLDVFLIHLLEIK